MSREGLRSLPWSRDEYLSVDGNMYVYEIDNGIRVHLPGGGTVPLETLRERGCVIIPPRRWRTDSFA